MYLQVNDYEDADGNTRLYAQISRSYRNDEGESRTEIVANLGRLEEWEIATWKKCLKALRHDKQLQVVDRDDEAAGGDEPAALKLGETRRYLGAAVVRRWFDKTGLYGLVDELTDTPPRAAPPEDVLAALVAHRCLDPGSKRHFQSWIDRTAAESVFGHEADRFNNTRVHRVLETLAETDRALQRRLTERRLDRQGTPKIVYLDMTDVWFEAGGGTMADRAPTKAGHRSKLKIHLAMLIDEDGMPCRWSCLRGALNESTELTGWANRLAEHDGFDESVLIFDRGMQSVDNFKRLADDQDGRPFLSAVRRTTISSYVDLAAEADLDDETLDELQQVRWDAAGAEIDSICRSMGFKRLDSRTFVRDLGTVSPPPSTNGSDRPPRMRMYLYFNPEVQSDKRQARAVRLQKLDEAIDEINEELAGAKRSRKPGPTRRKAERALKQFGLWEAFEVDLEAHPIEGKTTTIDSFQIRLEADEERLAARRRYDGLTLLVGHPELTFSGEEAVEAYRHKSRIEANFRTIKTDLEIRPVYHQTDPKIRAHVTLCILALIVERAIEARLHTLDDPPDEMPMTAEALWPTFEDVELHDIEIGDRSARLRNRADGDVTDLLELLGDADLLEAFDASRELN